MTSACIDDRLTCATHGVDDTINMGLWNSVPGVRQTLKKLDVVLGTGVHSVDLPVQNVPNMLNWVQVGRSSRPWMEDVYVLVFDDGGGGGDDDGGTDNGNENYFHTLYHVHEVNKLLFVC